MNPLNKSSLPTKKKNHKCILSFVRGHWDLLHNNLTIASDKPINAIIQFVEDYNGSVPDHLQAFDSLAKEAGIETYTQTFLQLGYTYVTNPPDCLTELRGLHRLLGQAYLVQRLLEEINDQIIQLSGGALIPMDMNMANIITHTLLGDESANQLDMLVLLSVETTAANAAIFKTTYSGLLQARRFQGWGDVLERCHVLLKPLLPYSLVRETSKCEQNLKGNGYEMLSVRLLYDDYLCPSASSNALILSLARLYFNNTFFNAAYPNLDLIFSLCF